MAMAMAHGMRYTIQGIQDRKYCLVNLSSSHWNMLAICACFLALSTLYNSFKLTTYLTFEPS